MGAYWTCFVFVFRSLVIGTLCFYPPRFMVLDICHILNCWLNIAILVFKKVCLLFDACRPCCIVAGQPYISNAILDLDITVSTITVLFYLILSLSWLLVCCLHVHYVLGVNICIYTIFHCPLFQWGWGSRFRTQRKRSCISKYMKLYSYLIMYFFPKMILVCFEDVMCLLLLFLNFVLCFQEYDGHWCIFMEFTYLNGGWCSNLPWSTIIADDN